MSLSRYYCARAVVAPLAVLLAAALCPAQIQHIDWALVGGSGAWSNKLNWSPQEVPDDSDEYANVPTGAGATAILMDILPRIDGMLIESPTATLDLRAKRLRVNSGGLANYGTVINSVAGTAKIAGDVFNHGTIRAEDGTILWFESGTVDNAGGVIHATGTIGLWDAHVEGGLLTGPGRFAVQQGPASVLADVTIDGGATVGALSRADLEGFGTWTNNGTVELIVAGSNDAHLTATALLTFAGTGRVSLDSGATNDAVLGTDSAVTITNQADHTIDGHGEIRARLINYGTVNANNPNAGSEHDWLWLMTEDKTNNGTFRAEAGCVLYIDRITVTNNGTIDAAGTVRLKGCTIVGGTLTGAGQFVTQDWDVPTLRDVTIDGPATVRVTSSGDCYGEGTWTNHGLIRVNATGGNDSFLRATNDLALTGTGRLRLEAADGPASLTADPGVTVTNEAGHTIEGHGRIGASVTLSNLGTIEANAGGGRELRVEADIVQLPDTTLTGGTWIARADSKLVMPYVSDIVTSQADIILDGPGSAFAKLNTLEHNQGNLGILNGRAFAPVADLTNSATISIDANSALTAGGGFVQDEDGILELELGDPAASVFGRLAITGEADLRGTLALDLADGLTFQYGDEYEILTAAAVSGAFDRISGFEIDADLSLGVAYEADRVRLVAALPGDLNFDGTVNYLDYLSWKSNAGKSGLGWPGGDLDGDSDADRDDFAILKAYYGRTVPVPGAETVPEPSAIGLLAVGALALLRRRRIRRLGPG